jgi:hypothetical protein
MPNLGIRIPKMGIRKKALCRAALKSPPVGMVDALFTGTQQRVLGQLFGQPSRSYYATELIGLAGIGSGSVQRS